MTNVLGDEPVDKQFPILHVRSAIARGDLLDELPNLRVRDDDDDDPVLVRLDGSAVDTWREKYPYGERMDRSEYDRLKRLLQIELLKLQYWMKDTGGRLVVLFEGRDAAGKGGTIKRFMEHLNPRGATVVALEKPSERESTQWYFQRYISHLPAAGEMVFFDRSWYNRAGVERVMGFATPEEYLEFMEQTPEFERMLVRDGIHLVKFWFSVSRSEQRTRFVIRQVDPVRQWKLSPMDLESPWTVIKSNDKKRARIEAMRHLLSLFEYDNKDHDIVGSPDPRIVVHATDLLDDDRTPGTPSLPQV